MSQWSHEHPELVGHPDHDPWMQHGSYRKVAPMSEVERDTLRAEREFFAELQAGMRYRKCWQCGHLESAHTAEDRGCTVASCSCAQVPES